VSRSAAFDVVLTVDNADLSESQLLKYQELLEQCVGSCLKTFRAADLPKYKANFSFSPVIIDTSGMITRPAGKKLYDQTLTRLKWSEALERGSIDKNGRLRLLYSH
jgi:hypothetical protein